MTVTVEGNEGMSGPLAQHAWVNTHACWSNRITSPVEGASSLPGGHKQLWGASLDSLVFGILAASFCIKGNKGKTLESTEPLWLRGPVTIPGQLSKHMLRYDDVIRTKASEQVRK